MELLFKRLGRLLGTWYGALAVVLVLAAAVLLPGLGSPGLWEPQERAIADKAAPPKSAPAPAVAAPAATAAKPDTCVRQPPTEAAARTLNTRAVVWGRDVSDSDTGRRLPFALMGLLTVLAAAGIALRLGNGRAAVITALVLLAMPLLALQSRMLTSEIGTACGSTLVIYAAIALARMHGRAPLPVVALDLLVAVAALVAGTSLGFYSGGALLGLLVPIGAIATAGMRTSSWRERKWAELAITAVAALAATALLATLTYQLYELQVPKPGMMPPARALFGKAIVADGCWSRLLGGLWSPTDDLRYIFDSTYEEIAFGTFPWGILAPVAFVGLIASATRERRTAGLITLAWAAAAWLATEAFQRRVGFAIYAGFPAVAIAVGVWVDDLLDRSSPRSRTPRAAGLALAGLYFLIAVITFGKDMNSFPDRIMSLLVGPLGAIGSEPLKYPTEARMLLLPTKTWIFVVGTLAGLGFGLGLMLWRDGESRYAAWSQRASKLCIAAALVATFALAAFWAFGWQADLAEHVSSKAMFETYEDLRKPGDKLVVMGDLGFAANYSDVKPEVMPNREALVKALGEPERVFAIAPEAELCTLHRELAGKPYFIIDDRNVRNHLLSNKIEGAVDKNPLAKSILHAPPANMQSKPKSPIVWDHRLELIGWDIPAKMKRQRRYTIRLYYKVTQAVGGKWKTLMHIDGPLRFNANGCCDHWPIQDRCPTATWQPGDYIVDEYTLTAGGKTHPSGKYDVWIGWFQGTAPNFKNMPISEAPSDMRDSVDRVKVTSIQLE